MTELEKRDSGNLYDANFNPELISQLVECKDLCFEYNSLKPSKGDQRLAILKKLLGSFGNIYAIQSPFWCDYGYNIHIGKNFFANHGLIILDCAKVTFGDNVFIAPNCGFHTAGHPIDAQQRNLGLEFAHPITVGNDVWFGAGVQVMPGVKIGNNVVIGAGSIVTKNIPDNVVAVGNPCKVLRAITDDDKNRDYSFKG